MTPVSGSILNENGQIVNLVDLLGGGTPVSNEIHDVAQYAPRNGNVVRSDGTVINLVTLLGSGTPVDDRQYDVSQYMPASGLILGSDGRAYDLATLIENYTSGTPGVLLVEHITQFGGGNERDRAWFARHMEAGSYKLRITFSEPISAGTSASGNALLLKTASVFGEITGTELFVGTAQAMLGKTSVDAEFTLTQATDGFFLYAKLLKKGVQIRIFVNGSVTDSALLSITPVATLQGSSASPGEDWFPVLLAAGTHAYKLDVGGAAESAGNAVVIKAAASESDISGEALLTLTGQQCNGGLCMMDSLTLSQPVFYLYVTFAPSTKSTFTTTLIMV